MIKKGGQIIKRITKGDNKVHLVTRGDQICFYDGSFSENSTNNIYSNLSAGLHYTHYNAWNSGEITNVSQLRGVCIRFQPQNNGGTTETEIRSNKVKHTINYSGSILEFTPSIYAYKDSDEIHVILNAGNGHVSKAYSLTNAEDYKEVYVNIWAVCSDNWGTKDIDIELGIAYSKDGKTFTEINSPKFTAVADYGNIPLYGKLFARHTNATLTVTTENTQVTVVYEES